MSSNGFFRLVPVVLMAMVSACAPDVALGQEFCVRAGASGAGTGLDWVNAYPSLPSTLVRGATYFLADGAYGPYRFDDAASGTTAITIRKATKDAHGPSTGWQDSFGDGVAQWTSVEFATSHWVFDGVTGGGPGAWTSGFGYLFASSAGTDVNYVTLAGGIENITIRHASFIQNGDTEQTTARANAIYNATTVNDSRFEYLHVDNISGLPFFLRFGTGNIIQFNWTGNICGMSVADVDQHCEALVMHGLNDLHFRWNYIGESPSSGGFVKNASSESSAVRIYGNIFRRGFPVQCNTGTCRDWRVFNNTFVTDITGPLGGDGTWIGLLNYNNLMYGGYANPIVGTHGSNWFSNLVGNSCEMKASASENVCISCLAGCDSISEKTNPFVDITGHTPDDFGIAQAVVALVGIDVCTLDACTGEKRYNLDAWGRNRVSDGWTRGAFGYHSGPQPPSSLRVVRP